ncbi:helix-turn-helix transcriptional regulator [Luteimonas sp. 8-5]|uniref:helix-turn-helix domain-containing protein n=1 Tax=Luteimonas sp. 8-5 TaxID=3039387 RepID=UPI002436F82B|nr:helix-turn-helix transcriptional regulator [Luteimonas sp. 8-5]MDG6348272.1 helix-turn-helix transcriptional regulator [Luteimonas sp. 8-5]
MARHRDLETVRELRDALDADLASGRLSVGQAVRRLREISGLSQEEFARHRGIALPTLKRIELDKANPTVRTLERIGEVFGLKIGFVRQG